MRDVIFGYDFPAPVPVPTPEWPELDGKVFVRTITALERDAYEDGYSRGGSMANARARLVVMAACDKDGEPVFMDEDVDRVGMQPASVISRLWYKARTLSVGEGAEGAVKN